ncbi:hypothetical protein [Sulfitobacter sp. 1A15106]|uniref:hypothetical protein n=1 Tax=Sulfitobacter sp. 1A15106 TaxID=3368590 RepID=UPI003747380A
MTSFCETQLSDSAAALCGADVDTQLEQVADLLPRGRAWPRDPDSTMMRYWKGFAEVVKYFEDRACALVSEFFCEGADETLEIWAEQYGIEYQEQVDAPLVCLKPDADPRANLRADICAKVAAQGGGDCAYFTSVATALGWVVTCEDVSGIPPLVAGGCITGCAQLGVTPEPADAGSGLGLTEINASWAGRAVEHPGPEDWLQGGGQQVTCATVPGSLLGSAALGDGCCNLAGWFVKPEAPTGPRIDAGYCAGPALSGVNGNLTPLYGKEDFPHCRDATGKFKPYTNHAHHWKLTIDVPASMVNQQAQSPFLDPWCLTGCVSAGDPCQPLRGLGIDTLLTAMNEIKPAHTVLAIEMIWS